MKLVDSSARINTCRNGHPRTAESTYIRPTGGKECRFCKSKSFICRKRGAPFMETHCRNGHARTAENTYFRRGTRECRLCATVAQQFRRRKRDK